MVFGIKFPFSRENKQSAISSINIKWKGKMHSLPGIKPGSGDFSIRIPFSNKSEGESAIPGLKMQEKGAEVITAVEVSQPFKISRITPEVPISVERGGKVDITVEVVGPEFSYDGPITITLGSAAPENIKMEITKQVVHYKGLTTEIPNTAEVAVMEKGMIFKKDIQLLKAISFGTEINKIEINKPFKLVSTDPKIPAKIEDGNSYIMAFYIQAPDFNYSGPIELSIS